MLEAARVYAERLMIEQSTPEEKVKKAFQSIICRQPKKEELTLLLNYFEEEKAGFTQSPENAKKFIEAGEYQHEKISDVISLAALMQVVQTIYNMDEAITKT
jgi:hypothetical protein